MNTLEEVLASGEGVERPFRCTQHDDTSASASVNVLKNVWYCFACGAKGMTDGKAKAPSLALLQSMLEPERHVRLYPETWLELFHNDLGNWPTRFEEWSREAYHLGCDPLTGDATFPVYTPKGKLAGVGRRSADQEAKPRYKYPREWSASGVLGRATVPRPLPITMLTEGYADSIAVAEAGCSAAAVFGSGLHFPQLEHLKRLKPQLILLGFDADGAGLRGTENAEVMLAGRQTARVNWAYYGGKDPSEITLDERMAAIANAVIGAGYPDPLDAMVASRNLAMERWEHIKDDRGSAVG